MWGHVAYPHVGVRKVRWPQTLGCCVAKLAPNEALKSIAGGKWAFDERADPGCREGAARPLRRVTVLEEMNALLNLMSKRYWILPPRKHATMAALDPQVDSVKTKARI